MFFIFFFSEKKIWCFFARARKRRVRVLLCGIFIVRDLGSISEEFCARAKREIFSHKSERERIKRRQREEERKFSSSLFSLFLSVSYKINQKRKGVEEDPSCGSESVAVKKGGRKGGENFFFCSDIHSFSLLSYLQKQGITTRTIKGRYTRTL